MRTYNVLWHNLTTKLRKPIVIVKPNTITKETFDKVAELIKEHGRILAEVKEVNYILNKQAHTDPYYRKNDRLVAYIVSRGLRDAVIKTLTQESLNRSEAIIKEIEAIIPDYRLNQATELTEIQEALNDLLEALNMPGMVGQ